MDTENKENYTLNEIMDATRKRQWGVPLTEREAGACEWWDGILALMLSEGATVRIEDKNGRVLEKREIEKGQVN